MRVEDVLCDVLLYFDEFLNAISDIELDALRKQVVGRGALSL